MGLLNDFFGGDGLDMPNPTMTKDDYISQARDFINKVNHIYWQNWECRSLHDDEYPDEKQCENCDNHCVIKIGEYEYDCHPDHEYGSCFIRVFNEPNYANEMGELLEEFDHMNLINTEIELTVCGLVSVILPCRYFKP